MKAHDFSVIIGIIFLIGALCPFISPTSAAPKTPTVPRSYRGFSLGMTVEQFRAIRPKAKRVSHGIGAVNIGLGACEDDTGNLVCSTVDLYLEGTKYPNPNPNDHSYDDEFIFVSHHLAAFSLMVTQADLDRLFQTYPPENGTESQMHSLARDDTQTTFIVHGPGLSGPPYDVNIMDNVLIDGVQNAALPP